MFFMHYLIYSSYGPMSRHSYCSHFTEGITCMTIFLTILIYIIFKAFQKEKNPTIPNIFTHATYFFHSSNYNKLIPQTPIFFIHQHVIIIILSPSSPEWKVFGKKITCPTSGPWGSVLDLCQPSERLLGTSSKSSTVPVLGKHRGPTANTCLYMRQLLSLPGLQSTVQVLEPWEWWGD